MILFVVLNTSSMVSRYAQPSGFAYPTSKFAVDGMTLSMARELAPKGIRVNAVAPGITETDMVKALPESMIQPLINSIPPAPHRQARGHRQRLCLPVFRGGFLHQRRGAACGRPGQKLSFSQAQKCRPGQAVRGGFLFDQKVSLWTFAQSESVRGRGSGCSAGIPMASTAMSCISAG